LQNHLVQIAHRGEANAEPIHHQDFAPASHLSGLALGRGGAPDGSQCPERRRRQSAINRWSDDQRRGGPRATRWEVQERQGDERSIELAFNVGRRQFYDKRRSAIYRWTDERDGRPTMAFAVWIAGAQSGIRSMLRRPVTIQSMLQRRPTMLRRRRQSAINRWSNDNHNNHNNNNHDPKCQWPIDFPITVQKLRSEYYPLANSVYLYVY
jgi:hypothetical protein